MFELFGSGVPLWTEVASVVELLVGEGDGDSIWTGGSEGSRFTSGVARGVSVSVVEGVGELSNSDGKEGVGVRVRVVEGTNEEGVGDAETD